MLTDALEDIDQVCIRVNTMEAAGHDEALHDANVLRAQFSPTEIPTLPPHWDSSQRALQMVRVHGHLRVSQKYFQPRAALSHIVERLGKRCRGAQPLLLEAPIHPGKKRLHVRLAVCESVELFGFSREPKPSDVVFDGIDRANAPERLKDA
jgi:hypothetical protein